MTTYHCNLLSSNRGGLESHIITLTTTTGCTAYRDKHVIIGQINIETPEKSLGYSSRCGPICLLGSVDNNNNKWISTRIPCSFHGCLYLLQRTRLTLKAIIIRFILHNTELDNATTNRDPHTKALVRTIFGGDHYYRHSQHYWLIAILPIQRINSSFELYRDNKIYHQIKVNDGTTELLQCRKHLIPMRNYYAQCFVCLGFGLIIMCRQKVT